MSNLAVVRDQFTRQAVPFSKAPAIRDAAILEMMLEASGAQAGQASLDVACGPGLVVHAFAKVVKRAVGVDATPAMIDRARRIAHNEGVEAEWHVGLATALPFYDASFDIVTCRFAFHHFHDQLQAMKEMVRVCRPGGRIVVLDGVVPDDPAKARAFQEMESVRDPSTTRYLTVEGMKGLFALAGLPEPEVTPSRLVVDIDGLMAVSFPEPGQEQRLRAILEDSVETDALGMSPKRTRGKVTLAYRTALFAAVKP